jgi:hypothetical protein
MKDEFKGKTIILGVPDNFGLQERFVENLEFLGFDIKVLKYSNNLIKISLIQLIIHNYKKIIYKDSTYKRVVKKNKSKNLMIEILNSLKGKVDYALFIRPDLFDKTVTSIIKTKSNLSIAYQWDGMNRFPEAKNFIHYFDKFYLFDINDLKLYPNCEIITNFYFDDLVKNDYEQVYDVFFIGTYIESRIEYFIKIAEFFQKLNFKSKYYLISPNKKFPSKLERLKDKIIYLNNEVSFRKNIEELKKSRFLLDFNNDVHYGISLRTFEAVGYKKKLITTNPLVKYFDFYHPANIYVIEDDNFTGLKEFLAIPYQDLPIEIVEKYSFTNWLKNVLQIEPHYKITIPYGTKD